MEMPSLPAEGLRFLPRTQDQFHALVPIAATYIASHVQNIKIALLGPIVPQSNPVLLAEEMAMLDTMAEGRLIVGMLRGTTNEMLTYDHPASQS
jgi:alkanesulfonate monooxygenase SsuD/methylene tetrahydromethanopterin reductase-like flavin-dependent oxidoreductase (luciferase family)